MAWTLNKRGGAGAGDPNYPALKADPNATYNPFPPESTYLPGLGRTGKSNSSRGLKIIAALAAIFGGISFLLVGWALVRYFQRKKRANISRPDSSVGSRPLFSRQSRGPGWRELPPDLDRDDSDDRGGGGKDQIYGHEVFEMSREFNQSNYDLPFSTKQLEFEDEDEADSINSPVSSRHSSSPKP
ncbi:hypothetical protein PTTG_12252 [Puccinia triticina 1-1 BBBD Race 1]|uniref:Uncharacterized protein n=2 Tax=Puccinia triticina TaxID=208348 RepID=A0A180GD34_PUCT1|nr:uncharacterized protein PtA15_7A52 [Puccinia triticina]OAV90605.1 hypothetical protein PTTG_12252 [Puccinia triticina 1-1 BBBD Race 1]WAQ86326.1 hypothetical protein PtA15_7A52 [Puccinia triticina]WAR56202.1 hypothetical protein PtB15_7B47 [Puccinia triticina]